jgi:2',3'-cyclic-nucleotide 2'-phosphodiesterase (5'-nucleotidase family)
MRVVLAVWMLSAVPEPKELTVLYMSDRHGQVAPCHCDSQPLGGLDRQVATIADVRAKQKAVIVLDGGDDFFDSREQSQLPDASARAELIADALALIKPDVMMPGVRDFVRGAPALRELGVRARAPWIASNLAAPRERPPMTLPAHVAKVDGQRVLLLGVYAKTTLPLPLKEEKYTVEDPIEAVKRYVGIYRNNVDLIFVIVHGDAQTEEKVAEVEGVSVVFSAHEGRLQFGTRPIASSHIVGAGKEGKYLVRLDLRYRKALPSFIAGLEVQRFFRDKTTSKNQGLGLKDTLLFHLMPMSADAPSDPDLRARALTLDPTGYEMTPASAPTKP